MSVAVAERAPETIPELIAFARSKRTSLQAVARDIGTSKQTVKRWLEGGSLPSPENCKRIAATLKLEYLDVLRMAGHPVPSDTVPSEDPPWLAQLIAEIREMKPTPREVELVGDLVQGFRELREERGAYDAGPPSPAEPE